MIFETLWESAKRNELILLGGGFCHWHLRKDGQITIREIIVLPEKQGIGIGTAILEKLRGVKNAKCIFSKCPADLPANSWYETKGFRLVNTETAASGRKINHWTLEL